MHLPYNGYFLRLEIFAILAPKRSILIFAIFYFCDSIQPQSTLTVPFPPLATLIWIVSHSDVDYDQKIYHDVDPLSMYPETVCWKIDHIPPPPQSSRKTSIGLKAMASIKYNGRATENS